MRAYRLEATVKRTIFYHGHPIEVEPGRFIGSVESAELTRAGASLTAWAITNTALGGSIGPPSEFLIASGDEVIYAASPNQARPDLVCTHGVAAAQAGVSIMLDITVIPPPLRPSFTVYAFDGEASATALPFAEERDRLSNINIFTGQDFIRLIQSPSTRLSDPHTLAYAALHCMRRLPPDFAIKAAALCVIGYRLLSHEIDDLELAAVFKTESQALLSDRPNLARGLFLRWHTSVRLIAGYLAFQSGQETEALEHFAVVPTFVTDLVEWPQALTNILLGLFITAYLRYRGGQVEAAIQDWSRAESIFRFGASISEFQNYYAYGEVGNALRVVQECYIAIQVIRGGGPITNPSLGPPGMDIDLRRLPSPFAKLLDESKARSRSESKT
ncbi:hypothetical protein [Lichenicola sp.]|uniref:hypothetical protein n=1 Tax=Lichenicola sp. TaxID=2804529 RepID=UPI003AFFBB49